MLFWKILECEFLWSPKSWSLFFSVMFFDTFLRVDESPCIISVILAVTFGSHGSFEGHLTCHFPSWESCFYPRWHVPLVFLGNPPVKPPGKMACFFLGRRKKMFPGLISDTALLGAFEGWEIWSFRTHETGKVRVNIYLEPWKPSTSKWMDMVISTHVSCKISHDLVRHPTNSQPF